MALDPQLLEILACPQCKAAFLVEKLSRKGPATRSCLTEGCGSTGEVGSDADAVPIAAKEGE